MEQVDRMDSWEPKCRHCVVWSKQIIAVGGGQGSQIQPIKIEDTLLRKTLGYNGFLTLEISSIRNLKH